MTFDEWWQTQPIADLDCAQSRLAKTLARNAWRAAHTECVRLLREEWGSDPSDWVAEFLEQRKP